jgi:D-sedoheptulose 7-phosphate isomerase
MKMRSTSERNQTVKEIAMTVENHFHECTVPSEYVKRYFEHLGEIFQQIDHEAVAKVIELILQARDQSRNIFFIGNGGSAATASHFANDLAIGSRTKLSPFRVISLTDNNAVMTAIANDFGYEQLFVKQLEAVYREGDLLVAISASGNSPNVLKAVEYVKGRGGTTIGLTGFDGGQLNRMVDYALHVPTQKGEYGPVEDVHMIFDHIIGTYLMYSCRKE